MKTRFKMFKNRIEQLHQRREAALALHKIMAVFDMFFLKKVYLR